jgi:hypothetical protein
MTEDEMSADKMTVYEMSGQNESRWDVCGQNDMIPNKTAWHFKDNHTVKSHFILQLKTFLPGVDEMTV